MGIDLFLPALLVAAGFMALRLREQRQRIVLLASHLRHFQIEKLMENLTEGYLRGLGESEAGRREQVWQLLGSTESALAGQVTRFAAGFAKVGSDEARVSRLPFTLPYAGRWLPRTTFDVRQAFAIHARGLSEVAANATGLSPRDKAFMMSAELFLMQHTCHWFCKSRTVASARLLARHRTSYDQVTAAVSPATRRDYLALVKG
nr:hypothetical protein [Xylophilus sp.]